MKAYICLLAGSPLLIAPVSSYSFGFFTYGEVFDWHRAQFSKFEHDLQSIFGKFDYDLWSMLKKFKHISYAKISF